MRKLGVISTSIFSVVTAAYAQTPPASNVTAPVTATPSPDTPAPIAAAPAPIAATKIEVPATGPAILQPNTELLLRLEDEVSSKKARVGDAFKLTVAQDVMLGSFIVIPRGTPATGEVTYRTGKGSFGKSAKMEVEMRSINLNGRVIPVSGRFRQEGEGNTGATVGAAVAVGIFSAFVTGRSAVFQQGREFRAYTRDAIPVTLPNPGA